MNGSSPPRRPLRSVAAVFAGVLATVLPTIATDAAMHAAGVFPPPGEPMSDGRFLLALAYRVAYGVLGGYVTARLAPDRPVRHALILGGIGLVASVAGAAAMWDAGPAWYPIAVAASAVSCAWAGGRLGGPPSRETDMVP